MYLLGGADATGSPNDTVVYYVAGDVQSESLGARRGLGAVAFLTLLPGHFWSDSLFPPGAHARACMHACPAPCCSFLGTLLLQPSAKPQLASKMTAILAVNAWLSLRRFLLLGMQAWRGSSQVPRLLPEQV